MEKVILLRYGEIFLKGDNRGFFERVLLDNIRKSISDFKCKIKKIAGRICLYEYDNNDENTLCDRVSKVFGLHSLSVAHKMETQAETILDFCRGIKLNFESFKVEVRRADKRFPIKSMDFACLCGDEICKANPNIKVDVHNPKVVVNIDIREDGFTYISSNTIKCVGGMPVGTAGKGLVLLSGGIDSPVAAYYLARRGMRIDAIHFHSFPYTSEKARDKVIELAKKISIYSGKINLHILSFTKVQEEINKKCNNDYMIIIMRRIMMRVAEKLATKINAKAIITGENLAQVASQTIESITATNSVVSTPVFRPLIGFDKLDIIDVAKKIGTYDISILPYEDCCTIFLPKNPITKPQIEKVEEEESKIDVQTLVDECLSSEQVIEI